MAGGNGNQIWVTCALNDLDVPKALTLCFSLRRVLTNRKVGVVTSRNLSSSLKDVLYRGFDYLFQLEEEHNVAGLKAEEFVKLFVLRLKSFEKCVFLSHNMLVIKNCDEIFDEYDAPKGYLLTEEKGMDIFVAQPSLNTFRTLMLTILAENGAIVENYLDVATQSETVLDSGKYNFVLSLRNGITSDPRQLAIININEDLPGNENVEKLGFISKLILSYRTEIYWKCVQPFLHPTPVDSVDDTNNKLSNEDQIAIVGMSCRYPNSKNLEEFWHLLLNGKDGTGNPPEFRWLRKQMAGRDRSECRATNAGFLHYSVEEFDAKFFGISPLEMEYLDPQTRLLHELIWEGLEDAAVNPQSLRGTNGGVFMGSWTNDYKDLLMLSGDDDFYRKYMGNSIGAAAARISFLLGMTGPSIATESGCSASMVAVHLACRSLQLRETNFALACGVNLLLRPFDIDHMPAVISPDGLCKTFDAKADGFARAEGCGVLVLKRFSDAVRDGNKIWALIKGSGMSQEGLSKSMGTPTIHSETLAMQMALADANVRPEQVSFLETHGTGTQVGDPMEVSAIAKAYHSKLRKEPLIIGSVKTNVGHTESCSGITGIMKVVLAMQNEIIPAHRNFETLNPAVILDAVPAKIPLQPIAWKKKKGESRIAGVSSFGITGTDAHAIIEEPPSNLLNILENSELERPLHIMKITAKTEEALDILVERYKQHLSNDQDEFKDLAHTGNVGRADFSYRAMIIANSNQHALKNIEGNKMLRGEATPETLGNVCFLFTGQGSQYPGMAKQLYETNPIFRIHFEHCENILKNNYNIDITQVLWSEDKSAEVSRTIYSQTSIFCVEYALLKLWESWGVKADYALGHSLGEFAAAVCSGILTVEDALKLVAERSRLIDDLPHGKMLVIKAEKKQVDTLMKKFAGNDSNKILDYAAVNSPEQTVVAGDSDVILEFSESCKQANLKCILLEATHAFHSKHMDPMLAAYGKVAKTVQKLAGNDCKYISGMKGTVLETNQVNAEYWVSHTREKVLFMDASKKAVELGCKTFIEIGPQPILSALTMMNNDQLLTCLPSLRKNENEWETLLSTLAKLYLSGVEIDWNGFDSFYNRTRVQLPHYPFIGKPYWPDMSSNSSILIHPLLGSVIPNASASKLFQTGLNLKGNEWIQDHCIGDHVIFPGAGYLEMCLASGLATIEGSDNILSTPTRAMKIENLLIEAPLALKESTSCTLQTLAELNQNDEGWNDLTIKIFRRAASDPGTAAQWIPHANATFSPIPTAKDKEVERFSKASFLQTLDRPADENEVLLTQIYDKLASVGLKFGPTFKSIESIWRDAENEALIAKVKAPPHNPQYIIHPVIADAMIQSIMMLDFDLNSPQKKNLWVPIKIGKFVWLSGEDLSSQLYIHAFKQKTVGSALLVDSQGKKVAIMSLVELVETSVHAINGVLEAQSNSYPEFWEEVWKPSPTLVHHAADMEIASGTFFREEFHTNFVAKFNNNPSPNQVEIYRGLETLIYLNFIKALLELGWKPEQHQIFQETDLFHELRIRPNFRQYFGFILQTLKEEGFLEEVEVSWKVIRVPPSHQQILDYLAAPELCGDLEQRFQPTPLLSEVGRLLSDFLSGAVSPLSILFPSDDISAPAKPGLPTITDVYHHSQHIFQSVEEIGVIIKLMMDHVRSSQTNPNFVLRCLEIGSGMGSYSQKYLEVLEAQGVKFEYTYTDISSSFFAGAEKRFERHANSMVFKKLNIEEDPLEQGFTPDYFDLVIAAEVIHATKDIRESLRNIRILMKPWARVSLQETTRVDRFITFLFGTVDGYWRFQDMELRPKHCTLDTKKWAQALQSVGFSVEGIFPVFNYFHSYISAQKTVPDVATISIQDMRKTWLVFCQDDNPISTHISNKLRALDGRNVVTVSSGTYFKDDLESGCLILKRKEYGDFLALFNSVRNSGRIIEGIVYCWSLDTSVTEQEELLQPFFNLTKSLLSQNLKVLPRLSLFTCGAIPFKESDKDLSAFRASTLWGYLKTLKNEQFTFNCRAIEVADEKLAKTMLEEIFYEIWSSDKEAQVAISGDYRYVPRLEARHPKKSELKLPNGTDRFQLVLPETRSISDLQFGPLDPINLGEEEVEVRVKASGLNFRDVLNVIKPSEEFRNCNAVGFDLSGIVLRIGESVTKWKVGDRVIGFNTHFTALPSHVQLHEDSLMTLPPNMSFCDGATIPTVYITSLVCLLEVANIKKDDVVLIHTASGGVGLSAIEICKSVGCKIIATAGSKRKQNYLRGLGIKHVFHSRNTQFGEQILELTNGRGVDVVLNSLTSEGFKEATLKACSKGARFVEMSKLNIWSKEDVKALRPDVAYTTVDISELESREFFRYIRGVQTLMDTGIVRPLPYLRFDTENVREALQYLQKTKHIGKIVCVMPDISMERGEMRLQCPMFSNNATYLITGGLGGIGFAVCQWMIEKGAKHIILAGRNPPNPAIQTKINAMNKQKNSNIIAVQLEVGDFEECRNLLQDKMENLNLPPLKGIMHAAGTLANATVVNMDWEKLSSTFSAKINGTLNLHELTKNLNLEHFVMFSSVIALTGSPGQCNHAAGNAFEDAFAHYRNSIGLPATTINWGQWGEVGIAKDIELAGLRPISSSQALAGLEYVMKTQKVQAAIVNVDSFFILSKLSPQTSIYVDERVWKASLKGSNSSSAIIKSAEFWQQYEALDQNSGDKIELIKSQLCIMLRNILKMDERELVGDNTSLQDMGVDSLMFVEIKNCIQTLVGERLVVSASSIKECTSVHNLAQTLSKLIDGETEETLKPTTEQVAQLIRKDSVLPRHICSKEGQSVGALGDIRTIFLTGSTGNFGPYMLKDLTKMPQILNIICLIRPRKSGSLETYLETVLRDAELQVDMKKIKCVAGNIAQPHLGLEPKLWDELSEKVDAIFHCGAAVHHTEHYVERDSQTDIRAVNVGGTKNVLEFACSNKLKYVYYASSLAAVFTVDDNRLSERWPEEGEYDGITTNAYSTSKFVCDMLMKQAVERGIPCRAFRLPLIVGESETGRCILERNHALLRYIFIMKNGLMPSTPWVIPMLPVDICADVSLRLFFEETGNDFSDIYNVSHGQPDADQEFVNVAAKFGHNVEIVEYSEFASKVNNAGEGEEMSALAMFVEFYNEKAMLKMYENAALFRKWSGTREETEQLWRSTKVPQSIPTFYESQKPTMEYVYRDLCYCKEQGWFEKYGL